MQRHQLVGGLLAAVVGATALTGCGLEEELGLDDGATPQSPSAPSGTVGDLPGLPTPAEATEQLSALKVAPPGSMAGYSREEFPHWASQDGCSVRQTVLLRDGENVEVNDDCQPVAGEWYSAFDGVTLTDASDIDIDHIVPLANAWRSGADSWDRERRREFANDLENPQLIAVSARSNREKGDQSPDQWEPVEEYWCTYALAWTGVKHAYGLSVTEDEHERLGEMIGTCAS
ncbi:HNH endonuclease family protein [Streptomyces sodiiphilus]|uniref:HNH endonuclease family protein n=1 Tax=Streptomyces sodiiphilus TaxID=226217 RepID=A0ABN2P5K6_9ACTN